MMKYSKLKDSGIEWIGQIPEHWEIRRLKYLAKIETGGKDTIDSEDDGKYPFFVRSQKIERISTYSYDGEAVLTAGDGVGVGKVFHYINGKFDFHQRVYKISDFKGIDGKYFYYYIKENLHKEVMKESAKSTVDSLRLPMFLNFPIIFGNKDEQKQISKFLDIETTNIDSQIKSNHKLIKLLKEKRQTTINQTLTNGLDSTIPTKDSGIEWIGHIPEHWKVKRLKFSSKIQLSTIDRHEKDEEEQVLVCHYPHVYKNEKITKNIPFVKGTCTLSELEKFKLKKDDVIITKDSETADDMGVPALVIENMERTVCGYHLAQITSDKKELLGNFLFRFIQTDISKEYFEINSHGVTRFGLGKDSIGNLFIIQPSIKEQKEISEFLDSELCKIDSLILKTKSQIEKLQEFRHSLISSVVTGKFDQREEHIHDY